MTGPVATTKEKLGWRFPAAFWTANVVELFERAAFYGMFIALVVYLTSTVGFTDREAGYVAACFSSVLYLLPMFMGAMADRVGFRAALTLAFALLSVGYFLLGFAPYKPTALVSLALIMLGGAIVKPVISATVAKCSDARHRARAFSIFYQVVNIGAFTGKSFAAPLREHLGLQYINFYAAAMAFFALIFVVFFFRNVDGSSSAKKPEEALKGLLRVVRNVRFMALILIVAGFWTIQGQLYATMPKYILRLLGDGAKPEWLANINPLVVVICVVPITHLLRGWRPENSMAVGLFIIPFSALSIAMSPLLESLTGSSVSLGGLMTLHPITVMVVIGIGLQGLAECFLSPRFLEYASQQAPPGEEGLYMGYQHLTTFFAWAFGFAVSGHLLERFCPDPRLLDSGRFAQWQAAISTGSPMPDAYVNAHYIWFAYAAVGFAAFFALLVFKFVTLWVGKRKGVGSRFDKKQLR